MGLYCFICKVNNKDWNSKHCNVAILFDEGNEELEFVAFELEFVYGAVNSIEQGYIHRNLRLKPEVLMLPIDFVGRMRSMLYYV
ncbi:MAG: hypothetical protein K2I08_07935, partial [Muribaculaceae bacterium]|nr:hypothetical protein [Muribaculaceae bacterium]